MQVHSVKGKNKNMSEESKALEPTKEAKLAIQQAKDDKLISESTPEGKAFALLQRKAVALSKSDFMPQDYRGNVAKCIIAMELSERIGTTALAVAQNMYEVYGKPSWSSSFVISCINSLGKFSKGLRFDWFGEEGTDGRGCYAWAKDEDGDIVKGPSVTFGMAKAEGWVSKKGSKWVTIPELMTMYRAATFFGRLYTPEVMNGMHTSEEIYDIEGAKKVNELPKEDPFAEKKEGE
jgi:hypothetical protein